jgi:hypothetical protein
MMNVVNYDMPSYAKTYVHRAGRTARAGRSGSCFTLLRREEVEHISIEFMQLFCSNVCQCTFFEYQFFNVYFFCNGLTVRVLPYPL